MRRIEQEDRLMRDAAEVFVEWHGERSFSSCEERTGRRCFHGDCLLYEAVATVIETKAGA